MSQEWEMMASYHGFLVESSIITFDAEKNRYVITTPYRDTLGCVVVYATIDGDRIRITDDGYLNEHFLRRQDDGPFHIEMGIYDENNEDSVRREGDEFVAYCTMKDFGSSVFALSHTIMMVGTGKVTMLMMIQVFQSILARLIHGEDNEAPAEMGGWPGGTPFQA